MLRMEGDGRVIHASVRSTPESRHSLRRRQCPLSAISRHGRVRKERRNDGTDGHQDIEYCHGLFL
jgi:hypothetical protein